MALSALVSTPGCSGSCRVIAIQISFRSVQELAFSCSIPPNEDQQRDAKNDVTNAQGAAFLDWTRSKSLQGTMLSVVSIGGCDERENKGKERTEELRQTISQQPVRLKQWCRNLGEVVYFVV